MRFLRKSRYCSRVSTSGEIASSASSSRRRTVRPPPGSAAVRARVIHELVEVDRRVHGGEVVVQEQPVVVLEQALHVVAQDAGVRRRALRGRDHPHQRVRPSDPLVRAGSRRGGGRRGSRSPCRAGGRPGRRCSSRRRPPAAPGVARTRPAARRARPAAPRSRRRARSRSRTRRAMPAGPPGRARAARRSTARPRARGPCPRPRAGRQRRRP